VREWKEEDERELDEANVSDEAEAPTPQPEQREPEVRDPGLTDLSFRDYRAIVIRAGKRALGHGITDLAAALAYYSFLAIPAVLLVAVGLFSLFASEDAITTMIDKLGTVVPSQTTQLLEDSLRRMNENKGGSLVMAIVGFVLALLDDDGRDDVLHAGPQPRLRPRRGPGLREAAPRRSADGGRDGGRVPPHFRAPRPRAVMSDWIGNALNIEGVIGWAWWIAQWPILIMGLLAVFATVLYLGPNVDHPRWQFVTPGSVFAIVVWLLASGLFAIYTAMFASYNKAWGSLAAVIVMLTWLWLTGIALLLGAEINAEAERSRELRSGEPAERQIQAPPKA
jgi:membrane protein